MSILAPTIYKTKNPKKPRRETEFKPKQDTEVTKSHTTPTQKEQIQQKRLNLSKHTSNYKHKRANSTNRTLKKKKQRH